MTVIYYLSDHESDTLIKQIGSGNILAISGGRIVRGTDSDLILPVRRNIDVRIQYNRGSDTYTVQRIRRIVKGANRGNILIERNFDFVYAENVGEVAYKASLDD